jgi:hypothetical protein
MMVRFGRRRTPKTQRDGCGFVVLTCLFSCFFLILNSVLLRELYPRFAQAGPALLQHPRVIQAVMFIGPVALMFLEWWLVDLVVDLVTPRHDGSELLSDRQNPRRH